MRSFSPRGALPGLLLSVLFYACNDAPYDGTSELDDGGLDLIDGEVSDPPGDAAAASDDSEVVSPAPEASGDDGGTAMDATPSMDAEPSLDAEPADATPARDAAEDETSADASVPCAAYVRANDCVDQGALPQELRCTGLYAD